MLVKRDMCSVRIHVCMRVCARVCVTKKYIFSISLSSAVSSVLVGATRIKHLEEAVRAQALAPRLTEEEIKGLESAYKPRAALWQ